MYKHTIHDSSVSLIRMSSPPHGLLPSPSSCISLPPPSTSYLKPFIPSAFDFSRPVSPPIQPVSLATLSKALLRLRSVHAAKTRLNRSIKPNGTPTPTPTFVASEPAERPMGVAVTVVVMAEASVLLVSLAVDVVAANVTGANGFPKTLPNVALQQLVSASNEQQKRPLKFPESPQGTAGTPLDWPTRTRIPSLAINQCVSKIPSLSPLT